RVRPPGRGARARERQTPRRSLLLRGRLAQQPAGDERGLGRRRGAALAPGGTRASARARRDLSARAIHGYLGILDSLRPAALGGKPDEARAHFERAIELS